MPIFDDRYGNLMHMHELTGFTVASLRLIPELWNLVKFPRRWTVFEAEAFIVDFINDIPSLSKHDVEKRYDLIHQTEQ